MHIHTVQLLIRLGPAWFRQFYANQHWFERDQLDRLGNREVGSIETALYPVRGVRQAFLYRSPTSQRHFFFSLILNLQSLASNVATIELFRPTSDSLADCERNFRLIHEDRSGVQFPGIQDWSVQRIDYAQDMITGYTPQYVELAQRSVIPDVFSSSEFQVGSYYLCSDSEEITFNYYDKSHQMIEGRRFSDWDRLARQAVGVLRCEVQCTGSKLHHLRRHIRANLGAQNDYGLRFRTFLNPILSSWVIQQYYRDIIGYGDYYSLDRASEIIRSGPGRSDRHQRIIGFLRLVQEVGSVREAKERFTAGYELSDGTTVGGSRETLINIIRHYLPAVGVNPVLIPADMAIDHLPNPMPVTVRMG